MDRHLIKPLLVFIFLSLFGFHSYAISDCEEALLPSSVTKQIAEMRVEMQVAKEAGDTVKAETLRLTLEKLLREIQSQGLKLDVKTSVQETRSQREAKVKAETEREKKARIKAWQLKNKVKYDPNKHLNYVLHDDKLLISHPEYGAGTNKLDLKTGKILGQYLEGKVNRHLVNKKLIIPEVNYLVSIAEDESLTAWDVNAVDNFDKSKFFIIDSRFHVNTTAFNLEKGIILRSKRTLGFASTFGDDLIETQLIINDLESGEELSKRTILTPHRVTKLAVSDSGNYLAAYEDVLSKKMSIINIGKDKNAKPQFEELAPIEVSSAIAQVKFLPGKDTLLILNSDIITLYDVANTEQPKATYKLKKSVSEIVLNSTGDRAFITTSSRHNDILLNLENGEIIKEFDSTHSSGYSLAIANYSGNKIAYKPFAKPIVILDFETGEIEYDLEGSEYATEIRFSSDDNSIYADTYADRSFKRFAGEILVWSFGYPEDTEFKGIDYNEALRN